MIGRSHATRRQDSDGLGWQEGPVSPPSWAGRFLQGYNRRARFLARAITHAGLGDICCLTIGEYANVVPGHFRPRSTASPLANRIGST